MPDDSRSRFIEHLHEALSLALCCEAQDPPNPVTRAALQHSIQDLITEFQGINGTLSSEQAKHD